MAHNHSALLTAPICWSLKMQGGCKMSTYGAEMIAMKHATNSFVAYATKFE